MSRVFLSPAAQLDLGEIHDYVAADNETAAEELIEDIRAACKNLANHPRLGQSRDDLLPGARLIVIRKTYVAVYRQSNGDIEVVRIVHGHRDFGKLFEG